MPLVRSSIPAGKMSAHGKWISEGVQRALIETFDVPKDDLFQIISEYEPHSGLVRPSSYLGIEYSDNLIFIQLTVSKRTHEPWSRRSGFSGASPTTYPEARAASGRHFHQPR